MDRAVFRHAQYAVLVVFAFLHALDKNALARFDDIDCTPLKEADVRDFSAGEQVAAVIQRYHRVARDTYEKIRALVFKFWYDVAFAVFEVDAFVGVNREACDGIQGYKRNAPAAAWLDLLNFQANAFLLRGILVDAGRTGSTGDLEHVALTC